MHGFAKNDTANLTPRSLTVLKALARVLLDLRAEMLEETVARGEILEIKTDDHVQER